MDQTEQLLEKYDLQRENLPECPKKWNTELLKQKEIIKELFSFIDFTSLKTTDSANSIQELCDKIPDFQKKFPDIPLMAAVCVYPVFASVLKARLGNVDIKRAVVSGGFPSSQTFLDLKVLETEKALELGANEIDIVISAGEFLEGNYEMVMEEIRTIKSKIKEVPLKVIIETGALTTDENIWEASIIAMEAGADFIKTSTGKIEPAATPGAVWVMAHAIKAFYENTGKAVGLKVAGGISTTDDALIYFTLVNEVLGDAWLTPERFRIGASRLANRLLKDLTEIEGNTFEPFF